MPLACLCMDRPDRGSAIRSTGERAVRLNRGWLVKPCNLPGAAGALMQM